MYIELVGFENSRRKKAENPSVEVSFSSTQGKACNIQLAMELCEERLGSSAIM